MNITEMKPEKALMLHYMYAGRRDFRHSRWYRTRKRLQDCCRKTDCIFCSADKYSIQGLQFHTRSTISDKPNRNRKNRSTAIIPDLDHLPRRVPSCHNSSNGTAADWCPEGTNTYPVQGNKFPSTPRNVEYLWIKLSLSIIVRKYEIKDNQNYLHLAIQSGGGTRRFFRRMSITERTEGR